MLARNFAALIVLGLVGCAPEQPRYVDDETQPPQRADVGGGGGQHGGGVWSEALHTATQVGMGFLHH